MAVMKIGTRYVGEGEPTWIVAELSANHRQRFEVAADLVRAAHDAGADAVKLQTYTAESLTLDSGQPWFRIDQGTVWDGARLFDLYREAATPWEWHAPLQSLAHELNMEFFSSPFDQAAVDFLESLQVPVYKVASFELVDVPLLERVAATGKPVILSTGMATQDEIELAIHTLRQGGTQGIALLKCTSAYPAPPESMNLLTIADMRNRFGMTVGLSDHTLQPESAIASVALGASIIEKHLTLSRADGGPDSAFSLEPAEFADLVRRIRVTERALGTVHYGANESDLRNAHFRRSLFAVDDIRAGDALTASNIRSIRPGLGLAPKHYREILGKRAVVDIPRGTPLQWRHIESLANPRHVG
ncbi:MAG TPA: pseudaminic acid synthase [Pirellulaceae bacterium]|nr:pseudaminic acid synthase [Pirellulaceae bacterium]